MSAKHTPARLTVTHNSWGTSTIYSEGEEVARVRMDSEAHEDDEQHCENARRLAACWNACDGVSTEHLEDDAVRKLMQDRDQLLAQRDEMLKVLQAVVNHADAGTAAILDRLVAEARAAIAKAIG